MVVQCIPLCADTHTNFAVVPLGAVPVPMWVWFGYAISGIAL